MPQVAGLALCAVGNLATSDMSRDLAMEVDKHMKPGASSNMRKKAALCTVRRFLRGGLVHVFVGFCFASRWSELGKVAR